MTLGMSLLLITGALIYFGFARGVLDRLYLSDRMALIFILAIIGGSYIDIPLNQNPFVSINIGGALIPALLAIYVLSRADTGQEITHSLLATLGTVLVIFTVSQIFRNFGEGRDLIDPLYIFAVSGGVFAYILGRSRRGSFVAGVLGFLIYNLINLWQVITGQIVSEVRLGAAGAFDSVLISGIVAVMLAEVIGETRERLAHTNREQDGEEYE